MYYTVETECYIFASLLLYSHKKKVEKFEVKLVNKIEFHYLRPHWNIDGAYRIHGPKGKRNPFWHTRTRRIASFLLQASRNLIHVSGLWLTFIDFVNSFHQKLEEKEKKSKFMVLV